MNRDFQIEFKQVIRDNLSSSLKELGFKKSNYNYCRETERILQVCNVQRSQFNHRESLRFTLNFGFIIPEIHLLMTNNKSLSKFPKVDESYIWGRSGSLIYQKDYWYELHPDEEFKKLSEQFKDDIENHLTPVFVRLPSLDSLLQLVRKPIREREFHIIARDDFVAVMECEFGIKAIGEKVIVDNYEEAIIPKSTQSKTVYPDGREEVRWSKPSVNQLYIDFLERIAKHYNIDLN